MLTGFSDVDGDTLSVSALTSSNGSVVDNGNGTFTITPTANYNGPVSLSYNVIDGNGGSIAASQSYSLAAVNDAPTGSATAVLAAGTEDTAYTVTAAALLTGFSDVDGDTLSVSGLTSSNGSVVDNGNGTFTITPTCELQRSGEPELQRDRRQRRQHCRQPELQPGGGQRCTDRIGQCNPRKRNRRYCLHRQRRCTC